MYKMNTCLILFVLVFGYVNCVYIKSLTGPTWFEPGDNVTLNCKWGFDRNGSLDSVRWFKDFTEIHRTLYSGQNVQRVGFPVRGVEINSVSTDGSRITLILMGKSSEGVYRCEVTDKISNNTAVASIRLRLAEERNGSQPLVQSWITAVIQMIRKLADKVLRAFGLKWL